jgi:hypothetical protein
MIVIMLEFYVRWLPLYVFFSNLKIIQRKAKGSVDLSRKEGGRIWSGTDIEDLCPAFKVLADMLSLP